MEYKTVGKSRPHEMCGETNENLLIRFIIHFLYVEHDYKYIDLFDGTDTIFQLITNPAMAQQLRSSHTLKVETARDH